MNDDASLLRRFAEQRAEDAFAELVRRHLNLVYFAALRQTNSNAQIAEDAAQATFTLLAQKAGSLVSHPNLAGWLHTTACNHARDLTRTEQRRVHREQAAHAMHELTGAEANDDAWAQIRPIIDDALADLPADDREAVLLRYFENRPYSEIGDTLQLGENAARMRVNRALEQLETALARRGVKSTAAALATALAVPAALAAPANLGVTITSTALAATTVVGTTATAFTLFKIMSSAKLIATATTLAALAAIGTAIYQNRQLESARAESASLRQQQTTLQTELTELSSRLTTEKKRANDADADNGRLLTALANAKIDQITTAKKDETATLENVMQHLTTGQLLAKKGQYEEALKEYLWCYDTGIPKAMGTTMPRATFLLKAITEIAKNYPPARAALIERRDAAEQQINADTTNKMALMDFASLNQALGEDEKNMGFFDSLPADDPRRKALAPSLNDQFIAAQRYNDMVQTRPYAKMAAVLALSASIDSGKLPAGKVKELTNKFADVTTKDIEALAGAGELDNANKLIGKLLEFDNSTETRAKIQTHLARAGHPELLKAQ